MPDQPGIDVDWDNWTAKMRSMLVFVRREDEVLLIRKKRGLGEGKINGPGGKVDEGETIEEAAIRETEEEVGLTPTNLQHRGELYFQFVDGLSIHCTVFVSDLYEGQLTETDEALPMWVKVDEVPYDEMWEDDRFWLPQVLEGESFQGRFTFESDKMLSSQLNFGSDVNASFVTVSESGPEAVSDEGQGEVDVDLPEPPAESEAEQGEAEVEPEEEEEAELEPEEEQPAHTLDETTFLHLQHVVESLIMASESPMSETALLATINKVASDQEAMAAEAAKAEEPFEGPDIAWVKTLKESAILAAIDALNVSYGEQERAFAIAERAAGFKIYTRPNYGMWVRGLFPDQKPQRLRPPALETLAIIAYRQPMTKADIEAVRGVSVDGVLKMLLDRGLVHISGRAEVPGRPLLYETSEVFLDHFGIRSVDDLPNAEELRQVKLPTAEVETTEDGEESESKEDEAPESGDEPADADGEPEPKETETEGGSSSEDVESSDHDAASSNEDSDDDDEDSDDE